jgi:selenocysteine lyase/cysteine desulfurase
LTTARAQFDPEVVYLDTASLGLPPRRALTALRHALDLCSAGRAHPTDYDAALAAARASYATLVGVDLSRVAVGSQASVFAALIAANLPDGSQVLTAAGEFTSIVFPFLVQAGRGVTVREVPLEQLPAALTPSTSLVSVSAVQSADGRLIDLAALADAAAATNTPVLLDPRDRNACAHAFPGGDRALRCARPPGAVPASGSVSGCRCGRRSSPPRNRSRRAASGAFAEEPAAGERARRSHAS